MIQQLIKFDQDELLFREYYYLDKTTHNIKQFKEKYQHDLGNLNLVLYPETLQKHSLEQDFFNSHQDITIIKHPRFTPYFYHFHDYFEIMYVLKGHTKQIVEQNEILLEEGNLFLLAPQVKHGIQVFDDETVLLNILVKTSTFLEAFSNYVRDKSDIANFFLNNLYTKNKIDYIHFHSHQDSQIQNSILQMFEENQINDHYSNRILCSLFSLLLAYITRKYQDKIEYASSFKNNEGTQIIQYISKHYKNITLTQISQYFHYSIPYCSKWIKETTGYSYHTLLTQIKIQISKQLLLNTSFSIAQIAEEIGYQNPETFIRIFKKHEQITPHMYRKNTKS